MYVLQGRNNHLVCHLTQLIKKFSVYINKLMRYKVLKAEWVEGEVCNFAHWWHWEGRLPTGWCPRGTERAEASSAQIRLHIILLWIFPWPVLFLFWFGIMEWWCFLFLSFQSSKSWMQEVRREASSWCCLLLMDSKFIAESGRDSSVPAWWSSSLVHVCLVTILLESGFARTTVALLLSGINVSVHPYNASRACNKTKLAQNNL